MVGRIWIGAALFALSLASAPQHAAADYWRYETETGGVAFTDDPKSIPAKYQAGAKAVAEESLFDYSRLSVVDPVPAAAPTRARVAPGDAPVPVFAWPVGQAQAPAEKKSSTVTLNVGGMQIAVDDDEEEGPLYVNHNQYIDLEGNYFDYDGIMAPTTIIRRGNKPIAYIDERGSQ